MDRIGLLRHYGLLARTVCCRNRRLDFAGWDPREAWSASCRTVAGSLRCPLRAGEPCGRPVVAALGRARPRGRRGLGQSALRSPEVVSGWRAARMSPRRRPPSPPGTLRVTGPCRVFTRRSRVRVPRFWRRCAVPLVKLGPLGPTLPLRSELAGSGWNYGRRRVMRANVCVNAGGARLSVESASMVSDNGTIVAILRCRERPGAGKRSAPGASDRDPNGPRPLAGSVAEGDRARARRAAPKRRRGSGR